MTDPIAIVGRSCLFPGATTPEQFWKLLAEGRCAISSSPENRWRVPKAAVLAEKIRQPGRACTDRGGYVANFALDARGFAADANEILRYDEFMQRTLHTAREAMRDAGVNAPEATPARSGAIFGLLCLPTDKFARFTESFWRGQPEDPLSRFNSGLPAHLLAKALRLDRGAFALDAACASSLYAIQLACGELESGRADLMLAGAVSGADDLFLHVGFTALEALSLTGRSRPFHREADGLLPAEGASFVVLKRLGDAIRDGNRIHALLRGIGVSNDGRSASLMTPSESGQEDAMRSAYEMARVDPAEISLIECHATGTPVGDACEIRSTGRIFAGLRDVPAGSAKSNIGHAMTAAGMAGLMKILGAMAAGIRPATLHIEARDQTPALDGSPFRLLRANEAWNADGSRKAALSAFGFGGNNAHLIVEEWTGKSFASPRAAPRKAAVAIVSLGIVAGDCVGADQFTGAFFGKGPQSRRTETIELKLDGLGFPPADLERSFAQQNMALAAASEAIAGLSHAPEARTGVYAGMGCDPETARLGMGSRLADSGHPQWTAASVVGGLANIIANRISSRFDLRGPSFAVMAEELSGLVALRLAARALQERRIDLAIAGAVDLCCNPVHEAAARALLAPEKHEPGDAAVFFAMKRLEDLGAGERVYAIFDPDDLAPAERIESAGLRFGHAHAASAMIESAAAVLECAHSARASTRPWIAPAALRRIEVRIEALGGTSGSVIFAAHPESAPLPLVMERATPAVFPRTNRLEGELAFVFPGAAASYYRSGRSLLLAFPDVVQEVIGRAPDFASPAGWIFEETARTPAPHEKLAAHTLLCQVHARLMLDWLGLKPQAAIGFSAGETNALLAFHVWRDADRFFSEFVASGAMHTHLGGKFETVNGTPWETWVVLIPERDLRDLLASTPGLRLLAIHADGEYLIAGPAAACARLGKAAQRIDFDMVVHCPDLQPFAEEWHRLHDRETFIPENGPRFYQLASGRSYTLSRAAIADALTAQALETLDFPRVIEQAWRDGVRVFLELGPRGSATSWIRKILGDREHAAIALDSAQVDSITQLRNAAAQLIACGVEVDLDRIDKRLTPRTTETPRRVSNRVLRLAAHLPPVKLARPEPQVKGDSLREHHMKQLAAEHSHYQETSRRAHEEFLATSQRAFLRFTGGASPAVAVQMKPEVVFTREQLEMAASGKISQVYGPEFEELDRFAHICRLPMPPMLLIDRVTKLEGEPRSMKLGAIHTETDVRRDSWYLHRDRIPAGLMIEGGQADMMLISWLGIDFQVRGERLYRMLGCEVCFHDRLARSGETLRYEIRITGHARQGDARIFFFQYDCFVDGRLAISMRNGQAGFFSEKELRDSAGILWNPETERPSADGKAGTPRVKGVASQFSIEQVEAAANGRIYECFGEGFEFAAAQQRPPSFSQPDLLLFDTVSDLNFEGGPWKRGFCRAEYAVRPQSWLFTSHFKDDPCLPGTIMLEGCFQQMAFYMMALGLTLGRDGWRFEPVCEESFELRCRGQVTPESKLLVCDVFVDRFIDGPEPVLFADALGTVDGRKAFHGRRIGLKLVPGNPLDAPSEELEKWTGEPKSLARVNGVALDYRALLNCAWGFPSSAFGEPYARFDRHERCPRLPGPPYHCMTRITRVDGEFGVERSGASVEAEFDVAPDAWYFASNGNREMPFSMLLEVGLQPCGWLSCFTGIPLRSSAELYFRNLDGTAVIHRGVPARGGVMTTRAKLSSIARQGTVTLVSFDVQMLLDSEPLVEMKTGFGFFTRDDLAKQAGLRPMPDELARFSQPSGFHTKVIGGSRGLATGDLLMIDRVTGLWAESIRAARDVRPSDWYFKAHFFQDPVQPGSLGLEALVQTLQFYAIERGIGREFKKPRFEMMQRAVWKYRGQVIPTNRRIETEVRITNLEKLDGRYVLSAEGWLWADGARIYSMPQLGLIISEGLRVEG
jgi:acyl transferase domain-containing protein/3-hydroxymyristoyl/3-hydroxydecanoyl-(acyl carrier protein) dehydratase